MRVADLDKTNRPIEDILDLEALEAGGRYVHARFARIIPQNEFEPDDRYRSRLRKALYRNYFGSIIRRAVAEVFSSAFHVRGRGGAAMPGEWAAWQTDVDGLGGDFVAFLRGRLASALATGHGFALLSRPDGEADSLADFREQGLGQLQLEALKSSSLPWVERSADGKREILWAVVAERFEVRGDVGEPTTHLRRWRVVNRETIRTFEASWTDGEAPPTEATLVGTSVHKFDRVPLLDLNLDRRRLGLGKEMRDPVVGLTRAENALRHGIESSAYAIPVFNLVDGKNDPPVMGPGRYLCLGPGESVSWASPPPDSYATIETRVKAEKDELYRVVGQMADGVDNNAAAVGRSGESKTADAATTSTLLRTIGDEVKEFALVVVKECAKVWGADIEFDIEGLDKFELDDPNWLMGLLGLETQAQAKIPSPTWRAKVYEKIAVSSLSSVDPETKDRIREEIQAGVERQEAQMEQVNDAKAEADRVGHELRAKGLPPMAPAGVA